MQSDRTAVTTWTLLGFLLPAAALVYLAIWSQTGDPLTAQTEIRRAALALESLAVEEIEVRVRDLAAAVQAAAEAPETAGAAESAAAAAALPHVKVDGAVIRFRKVAAGGIEILQPRPPAPKTIMPLPGDEQETARYEIFSRDLEEREHILRDDPGAETVLDVMERNFTDGAYRLRTLLARASFLQRRGRLDEALSELAAMIGETDPAASPAAGELPFVVSAFVLLDRSGRAAGPELASVRDRFVQLAASGEAPLAPAELRALAGRLESIGAEERSRLLRRARSLEIAAALQAKPALAARLADGDASAVVDGELLWVGGSTREATAAAALPAGAALDALLPEEPDRIEDGLVLVLQPSSAAPSGAAAAAASGAAATSGTRDSAAGPPEAIRTREAPAGIAGATLTVFLTSRAPFERSAAARRVFVFGAGALLVAALVGLSFATYRAVRGEVAAARARSDFMAAVSHELRTPLASIRTFTELLDADRVRDAGTRQRFMRLILSNCRRLSAMIENVLDLRRSEEGLMRFDIQDVELGALLEDLFRDIRAAAEEEGFAVELDIAGNLPAVRADATALSRAIFNICDNARKYSGNEKSLCVRAAPAEGGGAVIAISDRGPGIPEAEREAVFERFRRGRGGAAAAAGVGLGLSLAREAIEACGGRLELSSRAGEGATFTIYLPRAEDDDDCAAGQDPDHRG